TTIHLGAGADTAIVQDVGGETSIWGDAGPSTFTVSGSAPAGAALRLHGDAAVDHATVSNWSGTLYIDGADGADVVTLNLTGSLSATINVSDSGSDGSDSLTINGT